MTHTPREAHRKRDGLTLPTTDTPAALQVGLFDRYQRAGGAIDQLIALGVAPERISVVSSRELPEVHEDVEQVEGGIVERRLPGALTGGVTGSVLGALAVAGGVVATGGSALLFAGPLLAGAAAGGVTGTFVSTMVSRGLEPDLADYYDHAVARGQILVAVEPPRDADEPGQERVSGVLRILGADVKDA